MKTFEEIEAQMAKAARDEQKEAKDSTDRVTAELIQLRQNIEDRAGEWVQTELSDLTLTLTNKGKKTYVTGRENAAKEIEYSVKWDAVGGMGKSSIPGPEFQSEDNMLMWVSTQIKKPS